MGCKYSSISDPQLNDLPLLWDSSNSSWRVCTLQDIFTLFEASSTAAAVPVEEADTQYSAPSTGFDIIVGVNDHDTHLIITPVITLADGTITLPAPDNLRDKQLLICNCTQQITTLTVSGNGAGVNGAPTSMGADDFFTLKYDLTMNTWSRIG